MDDLLSEFLTETNENISVLDTELVTLEQNPDNPPLIDNIFRLVHTIKGTCGFLGLPRLEMLAHATENVLGKFRDGELMATPEAVTLVLTSFDQIKEILSVIEATETEPEGDDGELIAQLDAMAAGGSAAPATTETPASEPDASADEGAGENGNQVSLDELEAAFQAAPGPEDAAASETPAPQASGSDRDATLAELEAAFQAAPGPEETAAAPAKPAADESASAPAPSQKAEKTSAAQAGNGKANGKANGKGGESGNLSNQTIRVNVELLENLMTMVSELVLSRNQLLQMVRGREDSEFTVPLQRLSHVTTELQEGVMKTRMQPIGNAWAKLPRIVRDLSLELDKKIELEMLGADTELDRQVLELIKDPLTHMVRNSADHGLESGEERRALGKPEVGKVVLNAYHEGGHINIEISDDGKGLPVDRIRAKVIEKGLASEADLSEMSDQRVLQYIFRPGFSTAEKVTAVSGRGVGLDVVRTNIEKIGGTVDVTSRPGKGSTFTIKIPLTLAIVSALIVQCAGERFAIPQISVVELVRASADSEHKIETINGTPVLRLRDRLLPLVFLKRVLSLDRAPSPSEDDKAGAIGDSDEAEAFIVVSQVGNYNFGIVVDQVFDTEEIVVKPVAPILRDVKMFSGNTILGDGSVIMILDPNGIASEHGGAAADDHVADVAASQSAARDRELVALLVFRAGSADPKAVPLSLVARLEEIDVGGIESVDGQMVVQYRGRLMPLVKVDEGYQIKEEGRQPVLVFADGDRSMGLVVDEIVDIVEERLEIELTSKHAGLIGSAVIAGKATDVLDVAHYLTKAFGDWFAGEKDTPFGQEQSPRRLLLVEDSPFFRNMLVPLLQVAGYKVTTADDAAQALDLRDAGEEFDIIISDIEMPGMNGFEFAEAVKSDERWQSVPIVALSSYASPQDFDRGREAGFADYVAKSDRDALLDTLSHTLSAAGGTA